MDGARARHRLAAITFDDALVGVFDWAAPLLLERDLTATIFASTGSLGREHPGWSDARRCMTDLELKALAAAGFAIGSHGITHRPLTELSPDERATELLESRVRLESLAHVPVDLFAYPDGRTTPCRAIPSRRPATGPASASPVGASSRRRPAGPVAGVHAPPAGPAPHGARRRPTGVGLAGRSLLRRLLTAPGPVVPRRPRAAQSAGRGVDGPQLDPADARRGGMPGTVDREAVVAPGRPEALVAEVADHEVDLAVAVVGRRAHQLLQEKVAGGDVRVGGVEAVEPHGRTAGPP